MSVRETAMRFGVHTGTVYRWIREGRLKAEGSGDLRTPHDGHGAAR